jgi:hypothetical protein
MASRRCAVAQAVDLDDDVERARDLLADRAQPQLHARHQDQRLESGDAVARAVGVHGGQ